MYFRVFHGISGCFRVNRVVWDSLRYYRAFQGVSGCFRVFQGISGYYRVSINPSLCSVTLCLLSGKNEPLEL